MHDGEIRIRGTLPGFFFFGLSWQHLWWTTPDGSRERLIESGDRSAAKRCPQCGLVAFVPPIYRP
jgi:hypothetical protein